MTSDLHKIGSFQSWESRSTSLPWYITGHYRVVKDGNCPKFTKACSSMEFHGVVMKFPKNLIDSSAACTKCLGQGAAVLHNPNSYRDLGLAFHTISIFNHPRYFSERLQKIVHQSFKERLEKNINYNAYLTAVESSPDKDLFYLINTLFHT